MAAGNSKIGEAYEKLIDEQTEVIFLTGDSGVGKTWMARMLSDRATREDKFDIVLWVFMNREYDMAAPYKTFAHQLSLVSVPNEYEIEDEAKSPKKNAKGYLKEKVDEKLKQKRVLLIMDDLVNHKDPEKGFNLKSTVDSLLPKDELLMRKVIIIVRKVPIISTQETVNIDYPHHFQIEVGSLSEDESKSLLKEIVDWQPLDDATTERIIEKSRGLPSEIFIRAKALNHFGESEFKRLEFADDGHAMQLYEFLPRGVLFDWCRPGNQFIQHGRSLHYKELIAYWILEGYLGHFVCIENAYEKGYSLLMDVLDCGLLKEQSDGYVMVNKLDLHLDPYDLSEFVKTIPLGLGNVSNGDSGRILETNGMIKILCSGEGKKTSSGLLVDGNHLGSEIPEDLHQSMKEVEVLAIFNSTDESLPLPLFKMHNRSLLLIRHSDFLKCIEPSVSNVDHTERQLHATQAPDGNTNAIPKVETSSPSLTSTPEYTHQKLTVLEISGPNLLEKIPDEVFKSTPHLQSLNLSFLRIGSLPPSFYDLSKLVWLILQGCSNLERLESLKKLEKLQVLDLSGAKSFSRFEDRKFSSNKDLRTLNLSGSQVRKLPLLRDLQNLIHLLLRDCTQLGRLPKITALTKLQIIDLFGATNFKEFHDPSLENLKDLKLINISKTAVKKLPLHMGNPRELYLSGCTRLKRLSFIEPLKDLEILDVSGCGNLEGINENFIRQLKRLQKFDLSRTQVKALPWLSSLSDLRQLLVSNCPSLKEVGELGELKSLKELEVLDLSGSTALEGLKSIEELNNLKKLNLSGTQITCLPKLSDSCNLCELVLKNCAKLEELSSPSVLSKLEKLDLSGASELAKIQDGFFKDMANLHVLDLSETKIEHLPSLSDLKSLRFLSLRNCQKLAVVPDLETFMALEELDLSGTAIENLPTFRAFSHLCCLLLNDCSKLDKFNQDIILGLLKDPNKELPYEISLLTEFKVLELPRAADLHEIKSPANELKEHLWRISWPARSPVTDKFSGISMSSVQFLPLLEKNEPLQTDLSHFELYVHPVEAETRFGGKFSKFELFFRKISIQTRQLSWKEKQGSSETQGTSKVNNQTGETSMEEKQGYLDVQGFDHFPKGLELVLPYATNVFLVSNQFLRCFTDLGADNIKVMKACWVEKCSNLENILPVDEVETTTTDGDDSKGASEVGKNEEDNAGISESRTIQSGSLQSNSFGNLMCLYLEHCPKLSYICQSSQQLGNLAILQIKHCENLKTLFVDESADLTKLQKLQLWELPNLEKIMCKMSSLRTLSVGECPRLEHILQSTHVSPDLEVLKLRSCDKLKNVFGGSKVVLLKLHTLHLWDLPELQKFEADFPSNSTKTIRGCPALRGQSDASGNAKRNAEKNV